MSGPDSDIIYIRDLVFDTIIGVLPEERIKPQPVCINLEISVDTRPAAASTDLGETLDYAALASAVREFTIKAECLLVESLAASIADLTLAHPLVQAVLVDIHKPDALSDAAAVGVRIFRKRSSLDQPGDPSYPPRA